MPVMAKIKSSFCTILLFLLSIRITCAEQTSSKNIVLTLTNDNFTDAIAKYQFILVNFYAPWCGRCKALAPEFSNVAQLLDETDSPIRLAKVDAAVNDELAYEHQVRNYPTLKFFQTAVPTQYYGSLSATDIVAWLKKELEPTVKELHNILEIDVFLEEHDVAIIGFFKRNDTAEAKLYISVASEMKGHVFGITANDELMARYKAADGTVLLFKSYDENISVFNDIYSSQALKKFLQLESLPLIVEYEPTSAAQILHGPVKSLLLFFIAEQTEHLLNTFESLKELATTYRQEVLFVTITYDGKDKKRAFEYFDIQPTDTPTMRLIKLDEKDEMIKYKPKNADITCEIVNDFLKQYLNGGLNPYLLSQTLPDDWNGTPVKTLVASNFDDIAYDPNINLLVEFYAPWCGHCKQLQSVLEQLAERYKEDGCTIIAKIDAVSNELEDMKVTSFPTIKLFRRGDNKIIEYNGDRTVDGLIEFLEGGHYSTPVGEDENAEHVKDEL